MIFAVKARKHIIRVHQKYVAATIVSYLSLDALL